MATRSSRRVACCSFRPPALHPKGGDSGFKQQIRFSARHKRRELPSRVWINQRFGIGSQNSSGKTKEHIENSNADQMLQLRSASGTTGNSIRKSITGMLVISDHISIQRTKITQLQQLLLRVLNANRRQRDLVARCINLQQYVSVEQRRDDTAHQHTKTEAKPQWVSGRLFLEVDVGADRTTKIGKRTHAGQANGSPP